MNGFSAARIFLRRFLAQAFSLGLFIYFLFHLVSGDRGYFSLQAAQLDLARQQEILVKARSQRENLEKKVVLLRPESIDRDMLSEQARSLLGYTEKDERIVLLSQGEVFR